MIKLASTVILTPLNAAHVTTEASMKRVNAYPARIKTALTALFPTINAMSAKDHLEEQRLAAAENAFPPIAIHVKLTIPSAVSATLDMVRTLKENVLLVAQSNAKIAAPTRVNAGFASLVLAALIASLAPLDVHSASLWTSASTALMDTHSILVTHAQRTSKILFLSIFKKKAP